MYIDLNPMLVALQVDESAIKAEMEAKFKAEQEKTLKVANEEFQRNSEKEMEEKMAAMRAE